MLEIRWILKISFLTMPDHVALGFLGSFLHFSRNAVKKVKGRSILGVSDKQDHTSRVRKTGVLSSDHLDLRFPNNLWISFILQDFTLLKCVICNSKCCS